MSSLTFAEQVKIILKRRGMTIKRLAEIMEAETGKAMSRQNLTQRLGRDNFQEKDMRLIAKILGCPFSLDILGDEEDTEVVVNKKVDKKSASEITVGELAKLNEAIDEAVTLQAAKAEAATEDPVLKEAVAKEALREDIEVKEEVIEEVAAEEAAAEAEDIEAVAVEEAAEVEADEPEAEVSEELKMSPEEIDRLLNESLTGEEGQSQEAENAEAQKKGLFGGLFSRFQKKEVKDVKASYELTFDEEEEEATAIYEPESEESQPEEVASEYQEDIYEEEPHVEHPADLVTDEETVEIGEPEINPYTGLEYETNSVRMHPSKVGYVQVYDRQIHNWIEMTEWAFLGYQERQKVLLKHKYREPIYLD